MTSKRFFFQTIFFSTAIILGIVLFNVYMNEYGLFGDVQSKSKTFSSNERTSKYLLSYNYIPSNFDGILIGPSLSDNLNTKDISGFKIYNASIVGGNISELKLIAENVIQRGNLKFIIICLTYYITKDHGYKTSHMNPQEYWGSLGSKETIKLYIERILIRLGMKYSPYNDYGYYDTSLNVKGALLALERKKKLNTRRDNASLREKETEYIDEIAYKELAQTLSMARNKGIKIFAFYYPNCLENYNEARFNSYKERIDKLFTKQDCIWDFHNGAINMNLRKNLSNYDDGVHLSRKGASLLINEISTKLNSYYGISAKYPPQVCQCN